MENEPQLARSPQREGSQIDQKLKQYMQYRKRNSIEFLLKPGQKMLSIDTNSPNTANPLQRITTTTSAESPVVQVEAKTKSVLFQKFQKVEAHTEEQNKLMREINRTLDQPNFKQRLMRGLGNSSKQRMSVLFTSIASSTNVISAQSPTQNKPVKTIEEDPKKFNPVYSITKMQTGVCQKLQHNQQHQSQNPSKINERNKKTYSQLGPVFNSYGPARSTDSMEIRMIVTNNFNAKDSKGNCYKEVSKEAIQEVQKFIKKQTTKRKNKSTFQVSPKQIKDRSATVITEILNDEKYGFASQEPKQIKSVQSIRYETQHPSSAKNNNFFSNPNRKLQQFVQQVQKINTIGMTLDKSSSYQLRPETAKHSHSKTEANYIKHRSRQSQDNFIAGSEKDAVSAFLNNKWLQFVVDAKSLGRHEEFVQYLNECNRNKEQLLHEKQEFDRKKEIQQQYKSLTASKSSLYGLDSIKEDYSDSTLTQTLASYLSKKREKYKHQSGQKRMSIMNFNDKLWEIAKKEDENKLMEFESGYIFKIQKRRIIKKIRCLVKLAIQLKMTMSQVIIMFWIQILIQLIELNITNISSYENRGSFSFIKNARGGNLEMVQKMLKENSALLYEFDELQMTALHHAVKKRRMNMAQFLIKQGANINATDVFKQKPLLYSIINDDIPMIKILLSHKAVPWDVEQNDYYALCKSRNAKKMIKIAQFLDIFNKFKCFDDKIYPWNIFTSVDESQYDLVLKEMRSTELPNNQIK